MYIAFHEVTELLEFYNRGRMSPYHVFILEIVTVERHKNEEEMLIFFKEDHMFLKGTMFTKSLPRL